MAIKKVKIESVKQLENFNNEYVYDIGIDDPTIHNFFANDILVHNSCYFSAYKPWKNNPDIEFDWNDVDSIVSLYDSVAAETNDTFPDFMKESFHVDPSRSVIKAGRENIASSGIFYGKKRYGILVADSEGKRYKPEEYKIKATGIETKRSDTSKRNQEFLETVIDCVLRGGNENDVNLLISEYVKKYCSGEPWTMGSPKSVKELSRYEKAISNYYKDDNGNKVNLPGNVRASHNWNTLRKLNKDNYSLPIMDGSKIIICRLAQNNLGMDSIAYPTDEAHLPEWFKELPFDVDGMLDILVKKLDNLLSVLKWNIDYGNNSNTANSLFDWD